MKLVFLLRRTERIPARSPRPTKGENGIYASRTELGGGIVSAYARLLPFPLCTLQNKKAETTFRL